MQRYPGEEEATARRITATAPSLGYEEKADAPSDRVGHAPPPAHNNWTHQQTQAQHFPGYSPIPAHGYIGRSSDVQERQDRFNPSAFGGQWTYQNSAPCQAPGQQSTSVRDQWVALNQQVHEGLYMEGDEALQLHERHRHWGRHRSPSSGYRTPGFVMATLKLCVYHVLNVIFAFVGCGILVAGICTAASLIPVCCIGLLIFQVLVYIVFSLAQWDIKLGNYITPAHERASPNLLPPGRRMGRGGLPSYRISPSLAFFSPLSLMTMLYFVLIKPVIGALSFLSMLLVIAPTLSFLTSLNPHYDGEYYNSIQIYGVGPTSITRNPGLSLVGAICVTLLGVALMQLVAKISLGATWFFCCEKFAMTSRFGPYQPLTNNTTSYGTTATRS